MAAGFWYVMLRESEVFVYYFDVLILLCCRWEFSVAVPLGMNVFLNAELLNLCLKGALSVSSTGVVEVKPTYILLLSEIQSPKGHLNFIYNVGFFAKLQSRGEELFLMTRFEVLNLL